MQNSSLKPVIEKLESLFSALNNRFYNGELQKPVITVSPDTTKGAYGWCTSWKAWKLAKDESEEAKEDEGYFEINICAEYLSRPFEQVAETLLHEMVHLYNLQIGVQDTSRNGTYHNKKFKEAAEQHGLIAEASGKYGFTNTKLNEAAEQFVGQYAFNNAVYTSLINLCADICKRNGKNRLLWFGDKDKTLNYSPASNEMVLTVHRWFANKSCPGDWMYNRMGDLAEKVNAILGASANPPAASNFQATSLKDMKEADIIKKVGSLFTADQKSSGILASVSFAQFILESG